MYKALIVFLILAMLISLFSGAFFLIKDRGTTNRTAYSLGIRISIAVVLFATLVFGFATGQIGPNS
jgi:cytochrome bd-type quinol oxidase subunit 2